MKDKKQELTPLNLKLSERATMPLGVNVIFIKSISSKKTEDKVTVYSSKYNKSDLFALASEKPISKLF